MKWKTYVCILKSQIFSCKKTWSINKNIKKNKINQI